MLQMIQADGNRLLKKKSFWLALVLYLSVGYQNLQVILSEELILIEGIPLLSGFEAFITTQDGFGYTFLMLPLLVALGVGDFIPKERNSSMMSYMLKRTSNLSYIKNRILSLGVLSFMLVFTAQFLLLILSFIIFPLGSFMQLKYYFLAHGFMS